MKWPSPLVPLMLNAVLRPPVPEHPAVRLGSTRESLLAAVFAHEATQEALYNREWLPLQSSSSVPLSSSSSSSSSYSSTSSSSPPSPHPSATSAACPPRPALSSARQSRSLRVMQFNILAEGLSASPSDPPPPLSRSPAGPLKPRNNGGFDALPSPLVEPILAWAPRSLRLLAEIIRHDPTLLSLEECDHYADFFGPALRLLGYESVFQAKHDSPCMDFGYYSDGVAIFWKTDSFKLRQDLSDMGVGDKRSKSLSQRDLTTDDKGGEGGGGGDDAAASAAPPFVKVTHAMVVLDFLPSVVGGGELPRDETSEEPPLIYLATHLKAKSSQANEVTRHSQVLALLSKVQSMSSVLPSSRVLICGDFNADPVTTKEVTAVAVPGVFDNYPNLRCPYPLEEAVTDYKSAGKSLPQPQPPHKNLWSTWKRRGDEEVKHWIDYILYDSRSFKATAVLQAPRDEDMSDERLPDRKYPSDHLAIAADLELLDADVKDQPPPPPPL